MNGQEKRTIHYEVLCESCECVMAYLTVNNEDLARWAKNGTGAGNCTDCNENGVE